MLDIELPVWLLGLSAVGLIAVGIVVEARRVRRGRREHEARRAGLDDAAFLAELDVAERDRPLAVALRRGLAAALRVRAESIYPGDRLGRLQRLAFDGFDCVEVLMALEDELSVTIPESLVDRLPAPGDGDAGPSVGDYVRQFRRAPATEELRRLDWAPDPAS